MIGKIPIVLKIVMHINQARWFFRAAFHIAINFHLASLVLQAISLLSHALPDI